MGSECGDVPGTPARIAEARLVFGSRSTFMDSCVLPHLDSMRASLCLSREHAMWTGVPLVQRHRSHSLFQQ